MFKVNSFVVVELFLNGYYMLSSDFFMIKDIICFVSSLGIFFLKFICLVEKRKYLIVDDDIVFMVCGIVEDKIFFGNFGIVDDDIVFLNVVLE